MTDVKIQIPDKEDIQKFMVSFKDDILRAIGNRPSEVKEIEYQTRHEISKRYRISLPTLHKHIRAGMPIHKIGKRTLFKPDEVENYFINKNRK